MLLRDRHALDVAQKAIVAFEHPRIDGIEAAPVARIGGDALADVDRDLIRSSVAIRKSQDLFDDLTDNPDEWVLAQQVEAQVRLPPYRSHTAVLSKPRLHCQLTYRVDDGPRIVVEKTPGKTWMVIATAGL